MTQHLKIKEEAYEIYPETHVGQKPFNASVIHLYAASSGDTTGFIRFSDVWSNSIRHETHVMYKIGGFSLYVKLSCCLRSLK